MAHEQRFEQIQEVYKNNHSIDELDRIMKERSEWAMESHKNGAYGSAMEQMLTASLARQLKEFKENVAIAEKEAHKREVFPNETSS